MITLEITYLYIFEIVDNVSVISSVKHYVNHYEIATFVHWIAMLIIVAETINFVINEM